MIPAVNLILVRTGKVLLLRRRNTGHCDGLLSVVSGRLADDESVRCGAARGALEEVGLTIPTDQIDIVSIVHRQTDGDRVDFVTTCWDWPGTPVNAEPDRCSELVWKPLHRLPHDVAPHVRHAIANYRQGIWFDSDGSLIDRSQRDCA